MHLLPLLAAAQDTPGFQFLGFGYDLLSGNVRFTNGQGDPGFRTNIFKFTETEGHMTSDGKWHIPDKTTSEALSDCSLEQQVTIINDAYSYQRTVDTGIEIDLGFFGIEFAFSIDFETVENQTRKDESIFAQISSQCATYALTTHLYDHPAVDDDFLYGVRSLPTTYDEKAYMTFISRFGTHVVNALQAGGRWGWQMEMSRVDYETMMENKIDIELGIKSFGRMVAGISHVVDHKSLAEVTKAITQNKTFNTGGQFSPNVTEWMASVKDFPMPTHLSLTPLDELLTPVYVNDTNLTQKAAAMRQALEKYCPYLQQSSPGLECSAPKPLPPPAPRPIEDNAVRRLCVWNWGGFMMSWELLDFTQSMPVKHGSGSYGRGQQRCIDAELIGADRGDRLSCHVDVTGGLSKDCAIFNVTYDHRSEKQAEYECKGTTLNYNCWFTGYSDGRAQAFVV
eukprot:CAMPEP_0204255736 /NCGR_PEP_ID=MMETSP0468-20130131/3383_1 /ASSEMBLY_ACC=CAM_ASM_000383 /TAXON_ID=2969 /ORGANISM="Oxyrrhis marina" /LENGTH=451 /DNA_ID=CAMNT_0051229639 /DNA_START=29 /DNA_END=1384 /DNA_ORIENTATION=+